METKVSQIQTFPKPTHEHCQKIITKRQSIALENQRTTAANLVPLLLWQETASALEPSLYHIYSMKRFAFKKPCRATSFTVKWHAAYSGEGALLLHSTINPVAFLTNIMSSNSVSAIQGQVPELPPAHQLVYC